MQSFHSVSHYFILKMFLFVTFHICHLCCTTNRKIIYFAWTTFIQSFHCFNVLMEVFSRFLRVGDYSWVSVRAMPIKICRGYSVCGTTGLIPWNFSSSLFLFLIFFCFFPLRLYTLTEWLRIPRIRKSRSPIVLQ